MLNEESNNLEEGIQSSIYGNNPNRGLVYDANPKDLNSLISNFRVSLNEQNPDLSLYLEQMLNEIPNEANQKLIRFQY